MTEFDIASDIMNLVTSVEGVTNSNLKIEQIMLDVDTMRMRLIGEADKALLFRKPYQGYGQNIDSIKVQRKADRSLYLEIPKVYIDQSGKVSIGYIGGKDGQSPYRIITGNQVVSDDPFLSGYPVVHYREGYLTFRNVTPPDNIMLKDVVFEDPSSVPDYNEETSAYPIPNGMLDLLIGKVADGYLRTMYRKMPQPNTQTDIPAGTK